MLSPFLGYYTGNTGPAKAGMRDLTASLRESSTISVNAESPGSTPYLVIVSLKEQQLSLYRGSERVMNSRVSTGKKGHPTPIGIFSTLEKRRYHESNIYSNAPMPFMQRLTWSGIALHESGNVPGYPASHGCVRLPPDEAELIYRELPLGTHVLITDGAPIPRPFVHQKLFQPQPEDIATASLRGAIPAVTIGDEGNHAFLENRSEKREESADPLRIYFTRETLRERMRTVQVLLQKTGYPVSGIDGILGPETLAALRQFREDAGLSSRSPASKDLIDALHDTAGVSREPGGILYIRRNHEPVFESRYEIADPEFPLGTHLLLASGTVGESLAWNSVTLPTRIPDPIMRLHKIEAKDGRVSPPASEAYGRLIIPETAMDFITRNLVPGSSIAISDNGLGTETGKGTDFIVQTL